MARLIVNVPVKDVQCDEIWSFIGKKEKAITFDDDPSFGDYCFTAIERHSKLILNFAPGKRNQRTTDAFIEGLRHATASQNFQITTDGFSPYRSAIDNTLSDRVDFAQLIKVYRASVEGEGRYSPAEVVDTEMVPVIGNPDPKRICTSHVERQNLSMRTSIRRFTRLTMASARNGRITGLRCACGSPTTTFVGFIVHCALRPRWRQASLIACGIYRSCWHE